MMIVRLLAVVAVALVVAVSAQRAPTTTTKPPAGAESGSNVRDAIRAGFVSFTRGILEGAGVSVNADKIAENSVSVLEVQRDVRLGRTSESDALPVIVSVQDSTLELMVGSNAQPKAGATVSSYASDLQAFGASRDVSVRYAQNGIQAADIRAGIRAGTINERDGYEQLILLQRNNMALLAQGDGEHTILSVFGDADSVPIRIEMSHEEDVAFLASASDTGMSAFGISMSWNVSQSLWRTNNIREGIVNGTRSIVSGGRQIIMNVRDTFQSILAGASGSVFDAFGYGSGDWSSGSRRELTNIISSLRGAGVPLSQGYDFMLTFAEFGQLLATVDEKLVEGEAQSNSTAEFVDQALVLQAAALSALGAGVSVTADGSLTINTDGNKNSLDISMGELLITLGFSPSVAIDLQNTVDQADHVRISYENNEITALQASAEIDRLRDLSLSILGNNREVDASVSAPGTLQLSVSGGDDSDGSITITADLATAQVLFNNFVSSQVQFTNTEDSDSSDSHIIIGFVGKTDADLSGSVTSDGKVEVQVKTKSSDLEINAKGCWDVFFYLGSGDLNTDADKASDALVSFSPLAVAKVDVSNIMSNQFMAAGASTSDADTLSHLLWKYYGASMAFSRSPLDESASAMASGRSRGDDWYFRPAFGSAVDVTKITVSDIENSLSSLGYDHNVCNFVSKGLSLVLGRMGQASDVCIKIATDAGVSLDSEPVSQCFLSIMDTMSTAPISEPFMTAPVSASGDSFLIQGTGTPSKSSKSSSASSKSSNTGIIVGSVVGSLLVVSLVVLVVMSHRSRHTARYHLMPETMQQRLTTDEAQ